MLQIAHLNQGRFIYLASIVILVKCVKLCVQKPFLEDFMQLCLV